MMKTERWAGIFVIVVGAVWCAIAALALIDRVPGNPVSLGYRWRRPVGVTADWIKGLVPQGWAFFTRSPREPDLLVFIQRNGRWVSAMRGPHSRPENVFGLNRISRAQGVEAALILHPVPPLAWAQECRHAPEACLDRLPSVGRARNVQSRPTMCGSVGFVRRPPTPWAWSQSRTPVVMPAQTLRLEVSCESVAARR